MSDIRIILHDRPTGSSQGGGNELLEAWAENDEQWIWIDLSGKPDDAERRLLHESFGVPVLAMQDAHRERHPPKLEIFNDFIFLILRDLITAYEDAEPEVAELAMFVGKRFLITRHHKPVPSIDTVFGNTTEQPEQLQAGPAHLAYRISRCIVDTYTPCVMELETHLGHLEDRVFQNAGDDVIESLSGYNRALKRLRRHLVYQQNVMAQLSRPATPLPLDLNRHEFTDLFENLERLSSLCQLNQELATDLLTTHLSLLSHRLNQVMRVLTIVAVIFMPLGVLAGIYGMNFEVMPELGWQYGYFAVLGAMAAVVLALIIIFKRRGWL